MEGRKEGDNKNGKRKVGWTEGETWEIRRVEIRMDVRQYLI